MERNGESDKKEALNGVNSGKVEVNGERENYDESESLLAANKGGLSKKLGKPRRKVQWNDKNGNNLAEVLEFQPSDACDSDDEEKETCFCRIM